MSNIVKAFNGTSGALVAELPDYDAFKCSSVFGDVGGWSFNYPTNGRNLSALVGNNLEFALFVDGSERWRGFLDDDAHDEILEEIGGMYSFSGREISGQLDYALVMPSSSSSGGQAYTSATPGAIIKDLMDKAAARSTGNPIPGWTYTFTATTDSSGAAWGFTYPSLFLQMGGSILNVLTAFYSAGIIDWNVGPGKTLNVYNPKTTLYTDRPNVRFRRGQELQTSPLQRTRKDQAAVYLVGGDSGAYSVRKDNTAAATYGVRERYFSQSGVTDTGTLATIGDLKLSVFSTPRISNGKTVLFQSTSPRPFIDYNIGDRIYSDSTGTLTQGRLIAQSLTVTPNGIPNGELALNDYFEEREIQIDRLLNNIYGAAAGGSTPVAKPTTTTVDTTTPNAPAAPTVSSLAYVDNQGQTQANLIVSWPAVTANTDASALTDFDHYIVEWRYSTPGGNTWTKTISEDTNATFSPIRAGTNVDVRVACADSNGHTSAWSGTTTIVTANDSTPPPVPSTPVVDSTTFFGTLRVTWDGLGSAGETMPGDFDRVEVHMSSVSGFTPTASTMIDTFRAATVSAYETPVGTPYYFKFVSVDKIGNKSAASAQGTGTSRSINTSEMALSIGGDNLLNNSSFEDSPSAPTSWVAVSCTASIVTTNQTHGARAVSITPTSATIDNYLMQNVIKAMGVLPNTPYTIAGDIYVPAAQTGGLDTRARAIQVYFWDASNTLLGGAVSPQAPNVAGTAQRLSLSFTTPANTDHIEVRLYNGAPSGGGSVQWDSVQLQRGQVATAYQPRADELLSNTVNTAQIVGNAVTAAKTAIAAIDSSTGNLTSGAVTAVTIASGAVTAAKTSIAAIDPSSGNLTANSVTATQITAGAVTTVAIAANSVTAEKLTIGSTGDNLVANWSFEDVGVPVDNPNGAAAITYTATGNPNGCARWSGSASAGCQVYIESNSRGSGSKNLILYVTGSGVQAYASSDYMPVQPGRTYFGSCMASQTSAVTGGFYFRIKWYTNAKVFIQDTDIASSMTLGTQNPMTPANVVSGQVVAPANAAYASIYFYNSSPSASTYMVVDAVNFQVVTVSAQIADGAITSPKIVAGAITADKITVGTMSQYSLVKNSDFEDDSTQGSPYIVAGWSSNGTSASVVSTDKNSGTRCIQITADASYPLYSDPVPLVAGDVISFRLAAKKTAGTSGLYMRAQWLSAIGVAVGISDVIQNTDVPTSWTTYGGTLTAPAGTTFLQIQIYNTSGTVLVDTADVRKAILSAQIADGQITAAKIVAQAITADKLTVSSFGDNLIRDFNFQDGKTPGANIPVAWGDGSNNGGSAYFENNANMPGGVVMTIAAPANPGVGRAYSEMFPVTPGAQYYFEAALSKYSGAGATNMFFRIGWYTTYLPLTNGSDGTVAGTGYNDLYGSTNVPTNDASKTVYSGSLTAPSDARWARVIFYNFQPAATSYLYVNNVYAKRVLLGAAIQDGVLTASKIVSGSLTTASGVFGAAAIQDASIGSLSVGKITAGTLTADITVSARIKTANTGARVELNSSGLQAFDSSGNQTVNIASATGAATFTGTLATAFTGQRWAIGTTAVNIISAYSGLAGELTPGIIQSSTTTNGGNNVGYMLLKPPALTAGEQTGGGTQTYILMQSRDTTGASISAITISSDYVFLSGSRAGQGSTFQHVGYGSVNIQSTGLTISTSGGITIDLLNNNSRHQLLSDGRHTINNTWYMGDSNNVTTTASPHFVASTLSFRAGVSSSGAFNVQQMNLLTSYRPINASAFTVNSTEASKREITTHGYKLKHLKKVKTIKFRRPEEKFHRLGVIAEEIAEHFPEVAAYHGEEGYDGKGSGAGELFGVDLNGLVSVLLAGLQEANDRIETLESAIRK